jgi:ankyrin repeat protein
LNWASYNGRIDVVKLLLKYGANAQFNGRALNWASIHGHLDIVKLLLEHGADVHEDNDYALRWASSKMISWS